MCLWVYRYVWAVSLAWLVSFPRESSRLISVELGNKYEGIGRSGVRISHGPQNHYFISLCRIFLSKFGRTEPRVQWGQRDSDSCNILFYLKFDSLHT